MEIKMILADFNQISIAAIAQERDTSRGEFPAEPNLIKHFILNSIRSNNRKFKKDYGEMVICCDSRSWRKDHFKEYKANRVREADEEWDVIFGAMNEVRSLLEKYSPMKVVKVDGCEADDIIAWYVNSRASGSSQAEDDPFGGLGRDSGKVEDILILSGDKDFQQLQRYPNVYQYSPTLKSFIKCPDPVRFQIEQIARGDSGDGVPNVLSSDRALVDKIKQSPITKKFLDEFIEIYPDVRKHSTTKVPKDELERNFHRNLRMINLTDQIPTDVQEAIRTEVSKPNEGSLADLRKAFIEMRMRNLLDNVSDFAV